MLQYVTEGETGELKVKREELNITRIKRDEGRMKGSEVSERCCWKGEQSSVLLQTRGKAASSCFLGEQGSQHRATREKLHQTELQTHSLRFSWILQMQSGKGNGTEVERMKFLLC